jgi:hypothetical protein
MQQYAQQQPPLLPQQVRPAATAPPGTVPQIKILNVPVSAIDKRQALQEQFAPYRPIKTYRDARNWYIIFIDILSRDQAFSELSKPPPAVAVANESEAGPDSEPSSTALEMEILFKSMPSIVADSDFIAEYTPEEFEQRVWLICSFTFHLSMSLTLQCFLSSSHMTWLLRN